MNEFDIMLRCDVIHAMAIPPIVQRVIVNASVHMHNMSDNGILIRFRDAWMLR